MGRWPLRELRILEATIWYGWNSPSTFVQGSVHDVLTSLADSPERDLYRVLIAAFLSPGPFERTHW